MENKPQNYSLFPRLCHSKWFGIFSFINLYLLLFYVAVKALYVVGHLGVRNWPFYLIVAAAIIIASSILGKGLHEWLREKHNIAPEQTKIKCLYLPIFAGLLILLIALSHSAVQKQKQIAVIRLFQKSAANIERTLRHEMPAYKPVKIKRMKNAAKLLSNHNIDKEVILFACDLQTTDNALFCTFDLVDESEMVYTINYLSPESDPDSKGKPLARCEDLWNYSFPVGRITFWILLKQSPDTEAQNLITDNEQVTTLERLDSEMYENILNQRGEFLILDKSQRILDRVHLKEIIHFLKTKFPDM